MSDVQRSLCHLSQPVIIGTGHGRCWVQLFSEKHTVWCCVYLNSREQITPGRGPIRSNWSNQLKAGSSDHLICTRFPRARVSFPCESRFLDLKNLYFFYIPNFLLESTKKVYLFLICILQIIVFLFNFETKMFKKKCWNMWSCNKSPPTYHQQAVVLQVRVIFFLYYSYLEIVQLLRFQKGSRYQGMGMT